MHLVVGVSLTPGHVTACMTEMSEDGFFLRSGRFGENNQVWFEVHSFFCREMPGNVQRKNWFAGSVATTDGLCVQKFEPCGER